MIPMLQRTNPLPTQYLPYVNQVQEVAQSIWRPRCSAANPSEGGSAWLHLPSLCLFPVASLGAPTTQPPGTVERAALETCKLCLTLPAETEAEGGGGRESCRYPFPSLSQTEGLLKRKK